MTDRQSAYLVICIASIAVFVGIALGILFLPSPLVRVEVMIKAHPVKVEIPWEVRTDHVTIVTPPGRDPGEGR